MKKALMVKVWLIKKVIFEKNAQAGGVSKTCRSIQKTIPGRGNSQYQSPEVDVCLVYLKNCTEANLATVKCGEEQKELRSRDGGVGSWLMCVGP